MSYESQRPEAAQEILESNQVEYDLREPPTRADVGLSDERDSLSIGHAGGTPRIDVTMVLPGDQRLEIAAGAITVTSFLSADGEPTMIELTRTHESVDGAYGALVSIGEAFDIDQTEFDAWRGQATELIADADADGGAARSYSTRVFELAQLGDVEVSVEAATFAARDRVGLRYIFNWMPDLE